MKTAETTSHVIDLLRELKTAENLTIRCIKADNALLTNKLKEYCTNEGIRIITSAPHRHQQNGVIERAIRTTRDRSAAILGDGQLGADQPILKTILRIIDIKTQESVTNTNLLETLWPEAWMHAVYIKNRLPTRALKLKKTPFEALYDRKPDVSNMRPWGARAYVSIPDSAKIQYHAGKRIRKLQPRAWMGYFMGCEGDANIRIWNPEKGKVERVDIATIARGEKTDDPQPEGTQPAILRRTDNNDEYASDDDSNESDDPDDSNDLDNPDEPKITSRHFVITDGSTPNPNPRCRSCAKWNRDCDGTPPFHEKCSACKKARHVCAPQSQDPKVRCRPCAKEGRTCDGTPPFNEKCSRCKQHRGKCVPQDYEGDAGHPPANTGLPTEQKCKECRTKNRTCDGTPPFDEPCWNCRY
ncbi:hypothetical protein EKO04_006261 [Ascochyta lentis]|uniref:Integrase catalytic domain-containing protein n=1 Tax=Ascochyta lentis TaxID=205686 RepID=A0A8H7J5H4_9PLEO|nr:hypothetical protein EKO04_006261 [Ascochyta lentis]